MLRPHAYCHALFKPLVSCAIRTTARTRPILSFRMFSAQTGLPYAVVKGMTGSGGEHVQAQAWREWLTEGAGSRIQIFDYRELPGVDYKEKLKRAMEAFYQHYGRAPDFVVWDWIGKALDSGLTDAWQKREAYNGVASTMVDLAVELQGNTLTLAQANKDTKGKSTYVDSDTQDSRSLSDGMMGVVGITSIPSANAADGGSEQAQHQEKQWWVVCKCREEQALRIEVLRRFGSARFEGVQA